jgi:hypothetical protein
MKTAGEVLSVLFDERFMEKAQGHSKLFDSWADITAKNGITAASAHSRIKNLDRGILLVETDHPGWKQILQTKQSKLLDDYRRRFPDLEISGISLMLGKYELRPKEEDLQPVEIEDHFDESVKPEDSVKKISPHWLDAINDEDFKRTLINLEQSITAREKSGKK